jgi:hypothetical protein
MDAVATKIEIRTACRGGPEASNWIKRATLRFTQLACAKYLEKKLP